MKLRIGPEQTGVTPQGIVRSKEFTERPYGYLRCKAVAGLLAGCKRR